MNPEEILSQPALSLQQSQRQDYFDLGYLLLPDLIDSRTLGLLQAGMDRAIDLSRNITQSNQQFDLEKSHSSEHPRLKRVAFVDDLDPFCWEFCRDSIITDIAEDILGPNIRFRDLFINFKWADGGAGVKWHQDIAFYPHTMLAPVSS